MYGYNHHHHHLHHRCNRQLSFCDKNMIWHLKWFFTLWRWWTGVKTCPYILLLLLITRKSPSLSLSLSLSVCVYLAHKQQDQLVLVRGISKGKCFNCLLNALCGCFNSSFLIIKHDTARHVLVYPWLTFQFRTSLFSPFLNYLFTLVMNGFATVIARRFSKWWMMRWMN